VAADATRVYWAGGSEITADASRDLVVEARDAETGQRQWQFRMDGGAKRLDRARDVEVHQGVVYVAGGLDQFGIDAGRAVVMALDSATGTVLWEQTFIPQGMAAAEVRALRVGDDGNLYVSGNSTLPTEESSNYRMWVASLDAATGLFDWITPPTNGEAASNTVFEEMALASDRVFLVGVSFREDDGATESSLLAFDRSSGEAQWSASYRGGTRLADYPHGVVATPDGGRAFVFVTSNAGDGIFQLATVAFDGDTGEELWASRYGGPDVNAQGSDIAMSPDGSSVAVTGYLSEDLQASNSLDYQQVTMLYDAATGAMRWDAREGLPTNRFDEGRNVAFSANGETLFALGVSALGSVVVQSDLVTVAYAADSGGRRWTARYNSSETGANTHFPMGLEVASGRVIVSGDFRDRASGNALTGGILVYPAA
jgi:outer membrane protein assembly factor BamB